MDEIDRALDALERRELAKLGDERDESKYRERVKQAIALLRDAWNPVSMDYCTKGVNQAHGVLQGGDPPRPTRCGWTDHGEEGVWDTGCGNAFLFTADGPTENGFTHCPYCGDALDVKHP